MCLDIFLCLDTSILATSISVHGSIIILPKFIHAYNASIIAYIPYNLIYYSLFNIYCTFISYNLQNNYCHFSTDNSTKITRTSQVGNPNPMTDERQTKLFSCSARKTNCISTSTKHSPACDTQSQLTVGSRVPVTTAARSPFTHTHKISTNSRRPLRQARKRGAGDGDDDLPARWRPRSKAGRRRIDQSTMLAQASFSTACVDKGGSSSYGPKCWQWRSCRSPRPGRLAPILRDYS
jgi:hypothetical protein